MKLERGQIRQQIAKLKTAQQRSIYGKAFPLGDFQLDISTLSDQDDFEKSFIRVLLDEKEFELETRVRPQLVGMLDAIYAESQSRRFVNDKDGLSIGYPMLVDKEDELSLYPSVMPLFLWNIEMAPSLNRQDTWKLKRIPGKVEVNPLALSFLKKKYELDVEAKALAAAENMSGSNLSVFCNHLSLELGMPGNASGFAIVAGPDNEDLQEMMEEPVIIWSAMTGFFGEHEMEVLEYLSSKEEEAVSKTMISDDLPPSFRKHLFSPLVPDSYQHSVLEKTEDHHTTLVEGAPGTGKTFLAAHLALNTLANGGRCLVVSPHIKGLRHIQQYFISRDLGRYTIVFNDEKKNLGELSYILNTIPPSLKKIKKEDEKVIGYDKLLTRCRNILKNLGEHHKMLAASSYGKLSYTDMVGQYIHGVRKTGKYVLAERLDPTMFSFKRAEYQQVKSDIFRGQELFKLVGRSNHPLEGLHDEIFQNKTPEDAKEFVALKLEEYLSKADDLRQRILVGMDNYRDALLEHYEEYALEVIGEVNLLQDKIDEYTHAFGSDFRKSSNTRLGMYGIFSDRYYNIKEAKKEIIDDFSNLVKQHKAHPFFEYKFAKKDTDKPAVIQDYITDYKNSLLDWSKRLPQTIKSETSRLNSKSVLTRLDYSKRIGELEYAHDLLLEELNQAKLFSSWVSYEGQTLNRRFESVEDLCRTFKTIRRHMHEFDNFFPWWKHWLACDPTSKTVLTACIDADPSVWVDAFESWYFHNSLNDISFVKMQRNDNMQNEYARSMDIVRGNMNDFIQILWKDRQEDSIKKFKKKEKKLYQLLFGGKEFPGEIRMTDIMSKAGGLISDLLPVVFASKETAIRLFAEQKEKFDLVIIDDGHLVPSAFAMPLSNMGDRWTVIGDRHQVVGTDTDNLVDYLIESGYRANELRFSHRLNNDVGQTFINKVFYQNAIHSVRLKREDDLSSIHYHLAKARYDEEKGVNELEAEAALDLLYSTPYGNDGRLQSVALVTSTVAQRNLIQTKIREAKQGRLPLADRIQKLEQAGFVVLHYTELVQPFDTVIWSTTFGPIDLKGTLSFHLNRLNVHPGSNAINTIVGGAAKHLMVCTSISSDRVNHLMESDFNASGDFIKFLKFVHTNSVDNAVAGQTLLRLLEHPSTEKDEEKGSFVKELKSELAAYFEPGRFADHSPLDELNVNSLLLHPRHEGQPAMLVLVDYLNQDVATNSFEHELKVMRDLEAKGYRVFRIFSYNWWKNPKREARILASRLIKVDNEKQLVIPEAE